MEELLFSVITGTESLAYQDVVSYMEVDCYLEPLEDILTENLYVSSGSTPERMRLTTFGFYQQLKNGHTNTTHSLFVDEQFLNHNSIEYQTLRANRKTLVSKNFFINSIVEARSMMNFISPEDLAKLEDKEYQVAAANMLKYKLLGLSVLYAAIDVDNDFNLGATKIDSFETERELELHIEDKINEVTLIANKYSEGINRAFFFKISRKSYIRLAKHI